MGLDMYLIKKVPGEEKAIEVGYWRKANAIHGWFDAHCGGELGNCEDMLVTKDMLLALKRDCEMVLNRSRVVTGQIKNGSTLRNGEWVPNYQEGEYIENPEIAQEILPTTGGFFFGQYDYNQWYLEDLRETIEICDRMLSETDFEKDQIIYYAWW